MTLIRRLLISLAILITSADAQTAVPVTPSPDPAFEAATIKPNHSGAPMLRGLNQHGHYFTTENTSLQDLIKFAYDIQAKQIQDAPEWVAKERFDINAVSDQQDLLKLNQVRVMVRKLLADRFKLAFHQEQRELPAFILTLAGSESKLPPTRFSGPAPANNLFPSPGGWTLTMHNASIADFTGYLQFIILDRPVVDHTGLSGKFDFTITFTPDETQFSGNPPPPRPTDSGETAPSLFDAVRQQLGLKMESKKAPVNVLAIDHVERPSAN